MSDVRPSSSTDSAIARLLDRPVEPTDLAARGELVARPREAKAERRAAHVVFRIGAELLALPVGVVRRVLPVSNVRPIPHRTNDVLRGVCNVRGEIVLAADLRRLLGLPAAPAKPTPAARGEAGAGRMLVLDAAPGGRRAAGAEPWAVEVDAVLGVERIDPATVRHTPTTVERALDASTEGLADCAAGQVALLDAARVLGGLKAALR